MWGRHIENEIHEATKKAKSDSQANAKIQMVMRRLMTPPKTEEEEEEQVAPPPSAGQFRDPAARFSKE